MMTGNNALYFLDCRARETRMQFYRTFLEPKLYRYAKRFEYDKIIKRCRTNPKAAAREAKFRHEYAPHQTPLHLVLEPLLLLGHSDFFVSDEMREKRHEAAEALLNANEEAVFVTCVLGTTPVDLVCMDPYSSLKDLDMLIRVGGPKMLLMQDIEGRLPLHYACINNRDNLAMMKKLLDACPEAASVRDKRGRLALHYAAMASASSSYSSSSELDILADVLVKHSVQAPTSTVSVVALLIQTNKEAVSALDNAGMAPLHHLCLFVASDINDVTVEFIEVLLLLVQADPKMANVSDNNGSVPSTVLKDLEQRILAENDSSGMKEQLSSLKRILSLCDDEE